MLSLLLLICSEYCSLNNNQIIEEGLICCNNSVCDKYCYNNECIKSNIIWFCYKEGIGYIFLIKFVPSILFFFIGILIRFLFNKSKRHWSFLISFCSECGFNIYLFVVINGYFCRKISAWITTAIFISIMFSPLILFAIIINIAVVYPRTKEFEQGHYHQVILYNVKVILFDIWITIFSLSGYFMIFDTFAYLISKYYKKQWAKSEGNG